MRMLSRAPWMMVHGPRMRWLSFTKPWRIYEGEDTSVSPQRSQEEEGGGVCNKHQWRRRTAGPNTSFLSWIRIHPILHPGTSQRLARPPQDSMGTSLLSAAKEGELQPAKTCRSSGKTCNDTLQTPKSPIAINILNIRKSKSFHLACC